MKPILILLLLAFNLSATSTDRYHFCSGQGASLTFAESSFLNEPIINFMYKKIINISGANIEIRIAPENSNMLVSAINEDQQNPIILYFVAQRPKDLSKESDSYETTVRVFNLISNTQEDSITMKCSSQKVLIWPVDMTRL